MMGLFELVVRLVSGLVLLLCNGLFVTTEFALTRLRQFDREDLGDGWGQDLAWSMTEELEIYLTACQVGISITSILEGVVFEPAVTHLLLPVTSLFGLGTETTSWISVAVAVVIIQLMHTVWGEQSPTYLGVEKPREVVSVFAPILYGWTWVSYPLIWLGDHLAKWTLRLFNISMTRSWTQEDEESIDDPADLQRRMGELLSKGELSEERRREVVNALEISEVTTAEVMVPREDIEVIDVERSFEENLNLIAQGRFSRFPLVHGDIEDYRGTVYVPVLFREIESICDGMLEWSDVAVESMTVSADLPVS
jgi:CBS domain containing-hemolysin-like protein